MALVNNAGIAIAAPVEVLPPDELRHQLEVNVVGQVAVTQALLPALAPPAQGRIVFVGSIAGYSALPFLSAYAASKHAIEAIADSLRVELAPWGIGVTVVEPGTIRTPMWQTAGAHAERARRAAPATAAGSTPSARPPSEPSRPGEARTAPGRGRRRGHRACAHDRPAAHPLPRRPGRAHPRGDRAPAGPPARPGVRAAAAAPVKLHAWAWTNHQAAERLARSRECRQLRQKRRSQLDRRPVSGRSCRHCV